MERNIYGYDPQVIDTVQSNTLSVSSLMTKVYLWMTMALAVTGLTAYYVASNESLLYTIIASRGIMWGLLIAELALVWILSASINRLSFPVAGLMFLAYSLLNGATFSVIFVAYTMSSIATTFFATAATFGAMSLIGYFIKKDLSGLQRFFMMLLVGLIIATLVNVFFVESSVFDWVITYIGIFLFCGLTAYDTQKMKVILRQSQGEGDTNMLKIALLCSLSLYLDFINLFLYLLRFFGDRRS